MAFRVDMLRLSEYMANHSYLDEEDFNALELHDDILYEIMQAKITNYKYIISNNINVISLGCNCFPFVLSVRWGLALNLGAGNIRMPFDITSQSIEEIIRLLKTDFRNYHAKAIDNEKKCFIGENNTVFTHDKPNPSLSMEQNIIYENDVLKNRVKNFNIKLCSAHKIFIHYNNRSFTDLLLLYELYDIIKTKYNSELIVLNTGKLPEYPEWIYTFRYPNSNYKFWVPKDYLSQQGFELECSLVKEIVSRLKRNCSIVNNFLLPLNRLNFYIFNCNYALHNNLPIAKELILLIKLFKSSTDGNYYYTETLNLYNRLSAVKWNNDERSYNKNILVKYAFMICKDIINIMDEKSRINFIGLLNWAYNDFKLPVVYEIFCDLVMRYDCVKAAQWKAHIDCAKDCCIFGWLKKEDTELPQYVSIFQNGICIEKYIPACENRNDLAGLQIGNGRYGFSCAYRKEIVPYTLFHLEEPDSGNILAVRIMAAHELFSVEDILAYANKNLASAPCSTLIMLQELYHVNESNIKILDCYINTLVKNQKYAEISELLDSCSIASVMMNKELALLELKHPKRDIAISLEKALERFCQITQNNRKYDDFYQIGHILNALCDLNNSQLYKILSQNFANCYMLKNNLKNKNITNLFENKICVFSFKISGLSYIAPVLSVMPTYICEIVLSQHDVNDNLLINKYSLQNFKIIYDESRISDYEIIVVEQHNLQYLKGKFNLANKKIILLTAGLDAECFDLNSVSLFISEISSQIHYWFNKNFTNNWTNAQIEQLYQIPFQQKCEYGYTGLYHFGDFNKAEERIKEKVRPKLEEILNLELPLDKPVVVYFSSWKIHPGQIIHGLNRLADDVTLIVKLLDFPSNLLAKLDNRIIQYPDVSYSSNILRFSADWIMCDFYGGTALSSLAIGLPFIPVYTRYLKYKVNGKTQVSNWKETFKSCDDIFVSNAMSKYLKYYNNFFDILDTTAIRDAIFKNNYLKWYSDHLKLLQNMILGDYCLEGSVEKTAELIMKFAANGTVGNEIQAVYMHN